LRSTAGEPPSDTLLPFVPPDHASSRPANGATGTTERQTLIQSGTTLMRTVLLRALAALILGFQAPLWLSAAASAEGWTSKPIRIIVPFPPGGTTDQIARRVQPLLEADLKTTIVIENRGGASGAIGTQAAAMSEPNGTTFLLVFDTHGVNPSLLPNLPFDTLNDLSPIMLIGKSPMVITAHPATAYRRFDDVLAASRKNPGSVAYGTIGAGSLAHLAMSQIANEFKVTMTHVPYKGGGPLTTDAIAGHVPVAIASVALLSPHIQAGALRPVAVTSAKRYAQLPDTPTIAQLGIVGFDAEAWWGLLAPAKTPSDIIMRMNAAMAKALREPAVERSLHDQGIEYQLSSPKGFGDFIEGEIVRWAKVIKDNKIVAGE
jgi:tripartite-type tricarboxylate transporter receptor subunit TctC